VEAVNKVKFQFNLIPSKSKGVEKIPFNKWEPHMVVDWLANLDLRRFEEYKTIFMENEITGQVLRLIDRKNHWSSFGITLKADILVIAAALETM
jgi:hypothetical protein